MDTKILNNDIVWIPPFCFEIHNHHILLLHRLQGFSASFTQQDCHIFNHVL